MKNIITPFKSLTPPGTPSPCSAVNFTPPGTPSPCSAVNSKGYYSRGYLPHYDQNHIFQSITFRLEDSLPQSELKQLAHQLEHLPQNKKETQTRVQIEKWLDSGHGCCALAHPQMAAIMQDTLLKFHGDRYELIAWCIMPNHVHVLINQKNPLGKIIQSWKSYTGRWAKKHNAELGLGVPRKGTFWMRDYFDRYIRDERHLISTINYIHSNPVSACLCKLSSSWPWSSAHTPPP